MAYNDGISFIQLVSILYIKEENLSKQVSSQPAFEDNNLTIVTEFFLSGFQVSKSLRIFLFSILLVIYWVSICGNFLIITLVSTSKNLHTPMYFFISQLSITDIMVITDILPKILHVQINNGATITFADCITQFYFLGVSETVECFLLGLMSYDRYVAICNPLRYSSIMTIAYCKLWTVICWVIAIAIVLIYILSTASLKFCAPNIIDHVFCDILPLLELACTDAYTVHVEIYLICIPIVLVPTVVIVTSYTYITREILRISSSIGRQKAFSTCSAHLAVVSIFYWTMSSVYIFPSKGRTLTTSDLGNLAIERPFVKLDPSWLNTSNIGFEGEPGIKYLEVPFVKLFHSWLCGLPQYQVCLEVNALSVCQISGHSTIAVQQSGSQVI
ncbi:olfactory receptor 1f45-like [Anomaloglossus baeobatrachus]|uniref:olfactory receptor 1f45-like n=1 Tax=Anomaloglossus baeobatrachus TaxID=238106 RepID=UPI003F5041FB